MAGAASADGMDAFWELERALQEEMDARALCDTAPERRQRGMVAAVGDCAPPKRGLAAADFGLDDEGGLLSGELSGEDEPLPSAPAAEASDDGSDEECDAQARRRRAQSDLLLAAPARAGVAGRRRSHKRDHRARREQQAEERAALQLRASAAATPRPRCAPPPTCGWRGVAVAPAHHKAAPMRRMAHSGSPQRAAPSASPLASAAATRAVRPALPRTSCSSSA
ncbi:unnamed protein product [Prorocentrum cordatum]|uniref:Ribosome biogenesis protein NOP53 n=1 Tax=Prorocentrum cordatum TaxID=2364126 RepID=A0ABN9XV34_9DINO|nr:unnamed protein product [Polarella glacialis]